MDGYCHGGGLGNPVPITRNANAGGPLSLRHGRRLRAVASPRKEYHGLYARISMARFERHLLNPLNVMNRSGLSVKAWQIFQDIPRTISDRHDELDLPPGTAKLKRRRHASNGLRDSVALAPDFPALRLGIGHREPPSDRYVLGAWARDAEALRRYPMKPCAYCQTLQRHMVRP